MRRGPAVIAQAEHSDRPPAGPRTTGRRFRSPLWWGAAVAAATAVLLYCYLRNAGTTPVVSAIRR